MIPTPPALPPETVEASLVESLADWVAAECGAVRVDVEHLGVAEVDGQPSTWIGQPCRPRPDLRLVLTDGRRVVVRPHLAIWLPASVAAAPAEIGDPISLRPGLVRVEALHGQPASEGWVARVHIDEGQPLTTAVARPAPDALRDAAVDLRVTRGTVHLRAPGRLLEEGTIGEPVRVLNLATRTAQEGVLVDASTVELGRTP